MTAAQAGDPTDAAAHRRANVLRALAERFPLAAVAPGRDAPRPVVLCEERTSSTPRHPLSDPVSRAAAAAAGDLARAWRTEVHLPDDPRLTVLRGLAACLDADPAMTGTP